MNLHTLSRTRYTTKAYDASKRIPDETFNELLGLLRHAPSSVNSQPWHFVVAQTAEGRGRIARVMHEAYSYNEAKVLNASHVIVLCSRTSMPDEHLDGILAQEQADGRFDNEQAKAGTQASRLHYVDLHRYNQKDLQHWMDKQTYLALGTLLLGAAAMGVDATPIEGCDFPALDKELGLREQGFSSIVLVALGYRDDSDFNARLPKSRLPEATTVTRI